MTSKLTPFQHRMHQIARDLQGSHEMRPDFDAFKAIVMVEGVGLYISRDNAYGILDQDMEMLKAKHPGASVYKVGVAEAIK
jgi:hypothetical protein